mgnify:CR=1 FL=1
MSDNTYHVVDVDLTDAEELKPDVHLEVAGVKLDLPNLNNAELPIELVQAILLVKSKPALSDEETTACVSTFLAYFQTMTAELLERAAQDQTSDGLPHRDHQGVGRGIRTGPKSVYLAHLWNNNRAALAYDWIRAYGQIYRPVRFREWVEGQRPRVDWGLAWALTREILKDHTSHSWMALQNAVYAPDGAEQAVWTLSGQRKRPWFDHEHDPLRPPTPTHNLTRRQREDRERLKAYFHINDDL